MPGRRGGAAAKEDYNIFGELAPKQQAQLSRQRDAGNGMKDVMDQAHLEWRNEAKKGVTEKPNAGQALPSKPRAEEVPAGRQRQAQQRDAGFNFFTGEPAKNYSEEEPARRVPLQERPAAAVEVAHHHHKGGRQARASKGDAGFNIFTGEAK